MTMKVGSSSLVHNVSLNAAKAFASKLADKITHIGNSIKMLFNHTSEKTLTQPEIGSVYGKVHDTLIPGCGLLYGSEYSKVNDRLIPGGDSGYGSKYGSVSSSGCDSVYDSDCSAIYDLPQTPAENSMGKKIANGFAKCIFKIRNLVKQNAFNNSAGAATPIQLRDQVVRSQTDYGRMSAEYSSIYDLPNGFDFKIPAVATDSVLAAKAQEMRARPLPDCPQSSEPENVYGRLWELTSGDTKQNPPPLPPKPTDI